MCPKNIERFECHGLLSMTISRIGSFSNAFLCRGSLFSTVFRSAVTPEASIHSPQNWHFFAVLDILASQKGHATDVNE